MHKDLTAGQRKSARCIQHVYTTSIPASSSEIRTGRIPRVVLIAEQSIIYRHGLAVYAVFDPKEDVPHILNPIGALVRNPLART